MTIPAETQSATASSDEVVLRVRDLVVTFEQRAGGRRKQLVRAVDGASLEIRSGKTLGLVGESGSGKSTLGRAILHLLTPESGSISAAGYNVDEFSRRAPVGYRLAVQAVFQDPFASLNPSCTVGSTVGEALAVHRGLRGADLRRAVREVLLRVGLDPSFADRYPYEFSGGQRQRVAIARALALDPQLIVLDEPVSALDVSIQSQVINLLEEIQDSSGVSYLFIGHDLAVVRHISDDIVVMYRGRLVEQGPADRVCDAPAHPYTQLLLASDPDLAPRRGGVKAGGEAPARPPAPEVRGAVSASPEGGCPFAPRCPLVRDQCWTAFPEPARVPGGGLVHCHAVDHSACG